MLKKTAEFSGHQSSIYTVIDLAPYQGFISSDGDGNIVFWDRNAAHTEGKLLAKAEAAVFSMVYSPNFQLLIFGDINGDLYWIDMHSKKIVKRIRLHKRAIYDLLQKDKMLYSASGDGHFIAWEIETMMPIYSTLVSNQGLRTIVPIDNNFLVAGSDNNIHLVGHSGNATIYKQKAHSNSIFTLCKIHEGFISGGRDGKIKKWVEKNSQPIQIDAHLGTVNCVIGIDNRYLLSASRDKSMRLWDIEYLYLLQSLKQKDGGHFASINKILYLDDLQKVISVSDDRCMMMWAVD